MHHIVIATALSPGLGMSVSHRSKTVRTFTLRYRAFSIYKKIRKFSIGNFRGEKRVPFVTSPILGRPGRLIDRERHGTGDKTINL